MVLHHSLLYDCFNDLHVWTLVIWNTCIHSDRSWAQPNDIAVAASDETLCGLIHAPSVAVETGTQALCSSDAPKFVNEAGSDFVPFPAYTGM